MILRLASSFMAGLLLHGTRPMLDDTFSEPNRALASYAVGMVALFPFIVALFEFLHELKYLRMRLVVAYALGCVSFGGGVLAGYWVDVVKKT